MVFSGLEKLPFFSLLEPLSDCYTIRAEPVIERLLHFLIFLY